LAVAKRVYAKTFLRTPKGLALPLCPVIEESIPALQDRDGLEGTLSAGPDGTSG